MWKCILYNFTAAYANLEKRVEGFWLSTREYSEMFVSCFFPSATGGHTIFIGGLADDEAAKEWLKNGVSFVDVRHTGKACFADLQSDEDVIKAIGVSDDKHRSAGVSLQRSLYLRTSTGCLL